MTQPSIRTDTTLIAELNDLLQLDHDAVQAYDIAIGHLREERFRAPLRDFKRDHERHIQELTDAIRRSGGLPLQLAHVPTGLFKATLQRIGAVAGDRAILLAFKANERQVRDRYRKAAGSPLPEDVAGVVRRAAEDEEIHYNWALQTLDQLGLGPESWVGRAEQIFERGHKGATDLIEAAERRGMQTLERLRTGDVRGLKTDLVGEVRNHPLRSTALAAGVGFLLGRLLR